MLGFDEFSQAYFGSWEFTYERVTRFQLRRQAAALAFVTSERSRNRLLLARMGTGRPNSALLSQAQKAELVDILGRYGTEVIRACRADLTRGGRFLLQPTVCAAAAKCRATAIQARSEKPANPTFSCKTSSA